MEATLPMGPCPDHSKKINVHRKNLGYVSSFKNDIAISQQKSKIIDTLDILYDGKSSMDDANRDVDEDKVDMLCTATISKPAGSGSTCPPAACMKKCKWCDRIIYPPALPYRKYWCDVTCCGFSNASERHKKLVRPN